MILLAALLIQPLYLSEYKLSCPWQYTTDFIDLWVAISLEGRRVRRALHCIGFTWASLAVSENTHVFTVYSRLDEGLNLIENLALWWERGEDTVEVIKFGERQLLKL